MVFGQLSASSPVNKCCAYSTQLSLDCVDTVCCTICAGEHVRQHKSDDKMRTETLAVPPRKHCIFSLPFPSLSISRRGGNFDLSIELARAGTPPPPPPPLITLELLRLHFRPLSKLLSLPSLPFLPSDSSSLFLLLVTEIRFRQKTAAAVQKCCCRSFCSSRVPPPLHRCEGLMPWLE